MPHTLRVPPRLIVGPGSISGLGEGVASLGKRPLLVTGRQGLRQSGATEHILSLLADARLQTTLFEEVETEPSCETCDRVRDTLQSGHCDVVVGAGGGSALDAAKVAAGLAGEEPPTLEFWNDRKPTRPGVPFVAVPTTSGTGAEATTNAVITNT